MTGAAFGTHNAGAGTALRARKALTWGFLEFFVVSQTLLPALLFLPGTQPLRLPIRVGAYVLSLVALVWWGTQGRRAVRPHPSRPWLLAALAYVAFQLFHPTTNSVASGVAETGLYLAVMAPVFWVPGLVRNCAQLRRLLAILLVCNGVNSLVGILQVYDPAHWMPKELTSVNADGANLSYMGPDGRQIIRPSGLSDAPGAVCGPAATAALLGLVFCVDASLAAWERATALAFSFAGIAAIYLSEVRSSLVVVVGSLLVYGAVVYSQRDRRRALSFIALSAIIIFGGLVFAVFLGGQSISERFSSLLEEDPATVYYKNRGGQVDYSMREFVQRYPLGAGLGRWGMMRHYFGNEKNTDSPPIWAEIQFPAWLLDGGVVLLILYTGALVWTARRELRLTGRPADPALRPLAAMVFAVNVGTLALLFSFVPFLAPIGQQYWFLAGALHGVGDAADPSRGRGRG